jgi:hypothetical protein
MAIVYLIVHVFHENQWLPLFKIPEYQDIYQLNDIPKQYTALFQRGVKLDHIKAEPIVIPGILPGFSVKLK